jgi:hypothetical protein
LYVLRYGKNEIQGRISDGCVVWLALQQQIFAWSRKAWKFDEAFKIACKVLGKYCLRHLSWRLAEGGLVRLARHAQRIICSYYRPK